MSNLFDDVQLSGLLRPGGLLLIDTKRFRKEDEIAGVAIYRELRFLKDPGEWIIRDERPEIHEFPGVGEVSVHTKIHYDWDPSFSTRVWRANILTTVYGQHFPTQISVLPYYPLPAELLRDHMMRAELEADIYRAFEGVLSDWSYDFVVGKKPNQPTT